MYNFGNVSAGPGACMGTPPPPGLASAHIMAGNPNKFNSYNTIANKIKLHYLKV